VWYTQISTARPAAAAVDIRESQLGGGWSRALASQRALSAASDTIIYGINMVI